jgi:glycosyltransferase involved in cell wall biosynthesis
MLARIDETWVITRSNNAPLIESEAHSIPEADNLHFVYVDLPRWARSWKRGRRGIHLYYVLWQLLAVVHARRIMKRQRIDVVWHLTLANAWMGSLAPLAGGRFVYGPVGGCVRTPWRLARVLGVKGSVADLLRATARNLARYLNPAARLAWGRADLILVQNPETKRWLPRRHRHKAEILPNAVWDESLEQVPGSRRNGRTILFAARLAPFKGGLLAVDALSSLPGWRLVVCGTGPVRSRMEERARRVGVADRVEFRGWMERQELLTVMREEADLLLLPCLHEEAGMVVVEAAASGIPTVCLNLGGPPLLGGVGVQPTTPGETADDIAAAIMDVSENPIPLEVPDRRSVEMKLTKLLADSKLITSGNGRPLSEELSSI